MTGSILQLEGGDVERDLLGDVLELIPGGQDTKGPRNGLHLFKWKAAADLPYVAKSAAKPIKSSPICTFDASFNRVAQLGPYSTSAGGPAAWPAGWAA